MSRFLSGLQWRRTLVPVLLCVMIGVPATLSACSNNAPSGAPLPDTTFSRLLVELHLLSARAVHLSGSIPSSARDSLFEHYHTDREEFKATLRHYSRHPEQFESLYRSVIDTLRSLEQQGREKQYTGDTP